MKVKILKKNIKEGEGYCIKSLYVSVDNANDANELVRLAMEAGATQEQALTLIKKGDYNGKTTFAFGLNCSEYTFDRIKNYSTLDCKIVFSLSKKGYYNAKIQIVDKKEQINGYEEPEDDVTGWNVPSPEAKAPEPMGDGSMGEPLPITDFSALPNSGEAGADLPF